MTSATPGPAFHKSFSTVFTFSVLDYFYLDNMETETAARGFMTRLMRLTHNESLAKVFSLFSHFITPNDLTFHRTGTRNFSGYPENGMTL